MTAFRAVNIESEVRAYQATSLPLNIRYRPGQRQQQRDGYRPIGPSQPDFTTLNTFLLQLDNDGGNPAYAATVSAL